MWRLVTRTWWANPGRMLAVVLSVAIGVAIVVIITSSYETAREMIRSEVFGRWLGAAHLSIQPAGAHWGGLDAKLADAVEKLPDVAHVAVRLQRRMAILSPKGSDQLLGARGWHVDAVGIEPNKETQFNRITGLTGRMMAVDERGVCIMEANMLRDWELSIGDEINLTPHRGGPQKTLQIIGSFESQRLGDFQRPLVYAPLADVQELNNEPGLATAVDIMLKDTAASVMDAAQRNLEKLLVDRGESHRCRVESTAAAQTLLNEADRITRLILAVVTCIVMLTSFFIILSTMSISLFARRTQLGTMRCVGMTRAQLARMVLMEVAPPTCAGVLLGIAMAVSLFYIVPVWINNSDLKIQTSRWGLGLAIAAGTITALCSWVLLCVELNRVTPLAATTPYARPARRWIAVVSGVFGIALLLAHESIVRIVNPDAWLSPLYVTLGGCTLYGGYVALAPLLVVWLGPFLARLLGKVAGLHSTLTAESFTRSPWRATAACWVMTVGLALIVYHIVAMEAIRAIWNFPGRLPEAFVWSPVPASGEVLQKVRQLPTIKRATSVVDIDCSINTHAVAEQAESKSIVDMLLAKFTRPVFIASEPDGLLSMLKVDFVQGDADDARRKLAAGGHVLVPTQTAKQLRINLGDRITVNVRGKSAEFIVAGVIQSPPLDLAVTSFQANSYMQFAAAAALLGTNEDLRQKFGLDLASMIMVDLQLPVVAPPTLFQGHYPPIYQKDRLIAETVVNCAESLPEERELLSNFVPKLQAWLAEPDDTPLPVELADELRRFGRAIQAVQWTWFRQTPEENWQRFRERLVLYRIANMMERPDAILGSLHRLKQEVDRAIDRGTLVVTWLPAILLAVAMIGVANLMMVSVQTRSRQFAMLRAVGAVRSQILRLVLIEAATIGMVGSVVGVLLGLHQAATDNRTTAELVGFHAEYIVPIGPLLTAVGLTIGACLLAGLGPARFAARGNITAALQAS